MPFFSKNFIDAIKAIDKIKDMSRVGVKRMSSQLIVFSKKEGESSEDTMINDKRDPRRTFTNMFTNSSVCNRGSPKSNNSIVKLLNIYKNRKEDELAQSLKKEAINISAESDISLNVTPRSTPKRSMFHKNNNQCNIPEHSLSPNQSGQLSIRLGLINTNKLISRYKSKNLFDKLKK